jgi:hypothetical protein
MGKRIDIIDAKIEGLQEEIRNLKNLKVLRYKKWLRNRIFQSL